LLYRSGESEDDMPKPIQQTIPAFLCALIALGGSAVGYALKEGRSAVAMPKQAPLKLADSDRSTGMLAGAVKACRDNDVEACARVAGRLETMFAGGDASAAADRTLGRTLAEAAVVVIRGKEAHAPNLVDATLSRCAAGGHECERVATVLTGLFTGADAKLDGSHDRELARTLAGQLFAVASDTRVSSRQ
jgi:hypothetical protein